MTVRLLYNPASGRGRGEKRIAAIRAAFARCGFTDVRGTRHAGDETRLVEEAVADGVETIVVCGGDGTWSHCAVALARAGSPARMALLAAGTGNDFAKNLGIDPRDPARLARRLADGDARERRVDMGRVTVRGAPDTLFLNVLGFGYDVAVAQAAQRWRRLKGPAVYVLTALQEVAAFRGFPLAVDDAAPQEHLLAVFSNGAWFGGAFHIAPPAAIDDGQLDAILVRDVAPLARIPLLARAAAGWHLDHPQVTHRRVARMRLTFVSRPWLEADGELVQADDATVELGVLPGALRVLDA